MSAPEAQLLLVDDDASAIQVMSRMLAQFPNQRFATSGPEALRLARESTPDLILLDADMAGMTGLDICQALKADPALAQVPVIFVTSHRAPLLEVAVLDLGAVDFVSKPLNASQLTSRVRAQLQHRQLVDRRASERRARAMPPGQAGAQAPRLLIVDDDVAAIRILRRAVATLGEVYYATGGEEALRLARVLGPDLIVLDGQMPGMDGFAVCETLKRELAFQHVPVVFVTRFSDPRTERRAFDLGAADFLVKPYAAAVVHARLRNLLELKQHTDAQLQGLGDEGAGRGAAVRPASVPVPVPVLAQARLAPQPAAPVLAAMAAVTAPVSATVPATVLAPDAASSIQPLLLSYIAHELGNPLNGILGFAQLMLADTGQPLGPDQARRLEHVMASGRHLQALLRDLQDLGGLESGKLAVKLGPFRLAACVEGAATSVSALATQAHITLGWAAVPAPVCVIGDPDRLHQCLVNLLSNAIKYGRHGGWARIELQCHDKQVEIAVRDNGLGMNAAQRLQLFEPYNRLGRQGSALPGAGLGLMVTRMLMQAMNGELHVHSVPHEGSCFTLVLPRAVDVDPGSSALGLLDGPTDPPDPHPAPARGQPGATN